MVSPKLPDTAAMESSWLRILAYLRKEAKERIEKSTRVTSDVMEGIVSALEKRKGTFDLHKVTIQDITSAIVDVTTASDFPDEEKEAVQKQLCELFERYSEFKG